MSLEINTSLDIKGDLSTDGVLTATDIIVNGNNFTSVFAISSTRISDEAYDFSWQNDTLYTASKGSLYNILELKSDISHTHPLVSISGAGFMQYSDKIKLDTIDENANMNLVTSVAGLTGDVMLSKASVGLSEVDNTKDSDKIVSNPTQIQLDLKRSLNNNSFDNTMAIKGTVGDSWLKIGTDRTIDGFSYLDLNGDAINSYGLRLIRYPGENGVSQLAHTGSGTLSLVTANTNRLTINATTGFIGLGNTNPLGHLSLNNANLSTAGTGHPKKIIMWQGTTIETSYGFGIEGGTQTYYTPGNAVHKFYNGTVSATIDQHGIKFKNDTQSYNALNDYEALTYTPTIWIGSQTTNFTITNQYGRYVKIGNSVQVKVTISWSAKSNGTTGPLLFSIPFASSSNIFPFQGGKILSTTGFSTAIPTTVLIPSPSIAACYVYSTNSTGGVVNIIGNSVPNAGSLDLEFTYFVD